jgi:HrpA-like RNA helicase
MASPGRGAIAVTQPRRVAATSLAKRVAEEAGTTLGYKVCGSCIRAFMTRTSFLNPFVAGWLHSSFR